eukprot:c25823_g1_i1 orf=165-1598(-)
MGDGAPLGTCLATLRATWKQLMVNIGAGKEILEVVLVESLLHRSEQLIRITVGTASGGHLIIRILLLGKIQGVVLYFLIVVVLELIILKMLKKKKTISAVYAQIKSRKGDPPIGDFDALYDAMCAEVRRVVTEIRIDLEQSMKRSCLSEGNSEGSSPAEFMSTDVIQAVTDIRKEYAAKLEQSEKRVHELWSQLAIEEQRCLEFAKIVKELLPAASPSLQKVSHRRKASAEKQLVSKWLDEEAHKYFEECVSISSLDSSGGLDIPQEKDQQGLLHAVQDDAGKTRKGTTGLDQQITRDRSSLNEDAKQSKGDIGNDGVVLPWLQWGAERGIGERNSIKGVHSYFSPSSSSNSNSNPSEGSKCSTFVNGFSTSSSSSGSTTVRGSPPNAQASTTTKSFSTGTGIVDYEEINHGARNEQAKLGKETKPRRSTMAGSSTQDGKEYADLPCCDSDCLIAERIKFSHRIERGQLLLCGDISF